jgi:hypothetical protein
LFVWTSGNRHPRPTLRTRSWPQPSLFLLFLHPYFVHLSSNSAAHFPGLSPFNFGSLYAHLPSLPPSILGQSEFNISRRKNSKTQRRTTTESNLNRRISALWSNSSPSNAFATRRRSRRPKRAIRFYDLATKTRQLEARRSEIRKHSTT